MSAFICHPEHFAAIADFATTGNVYDNAPIGTAWLRERCEHFGETMTDPTETVARILYLENLRSVNYRYREHDAPSPEYWKARAYRLPRDPVAILKMLDCLEYQSCECPDYEQTFAYFLLSAIRKGAIRRLPGYDDAPWDYDGGYTHTVETITA